MDNSQKSSGILKASILELGFIVILVSVIVLTLNYFNIVPLSRDVPLLSFLPRIRSELQTNTVPSPVNQTNPSVPQPSNNQGNTNNNLTRIIITPDTAFSITNKDNSYNFSPVPNSIVKVSKGITLDVEMSAKPGTDVKTSGYVFDNGLKDNELKRLFLFFNQENMKVVLQYKSNGKSQYYNLAKIRDDKYYVKYTLTISADGKTIDVSESNGFKKTLQLPDALYPEKSIMRSAVLVAPNTTFGIYSLVYKY